MHCALNSNKLVRSKGIKLRTHLLILILDIERKHPEC
jgi:hypothetical protein